MLSISVENRYFHLLIAVQAVIVILLHSAVLKHLLDAIGNWLEEHDVDGIWKRLQQCVRVTSTVSIVDDLKRGWVRYCDSLIF